MTATSWLLAGIAAAGLLLAGNRYPSGWALVAGAQVLAVPAALAGEPYALAPLLAGCGLVALHHWRRSRRPLVGSAGPAGPAAAWPARPGRWSS